jgi:hypothetical protein
MNRTPPKRQQGWGTGKRQFNGAVLDVHTTAQIWFGGSEDLVRARVARGLIPFRKFGGRIIFLRHELEEFFANSLPGVTLDEARANLEARQSRSR